MVEKRKLPAIEHHNSIISSPLRNIMGDHFGRYSKYIIQDRALPDARGGLKPVQRRILYVMYEDDSTWGKGHRRSAKAVGLVIDSCHPHGDSSACDVVVRTSQGWKICTPQIDIQGNNESIDDDPATAMRYIEVRLGRISEHLLKDTKKKAVLQAPSFNGTTMEPVVLPARYPNLLVNSVTGVVAGYMTSILPHNLSETVGATVYRTQYADCSLGGLTEYIQKPDLPTGGIVQGTEGIRETFETGKDCIVIHGKTGIEQKKTIQQTVITEIPYEVIKGNMARKIDDVRLNKEVEGVLGTRGESDRDGLCVAVDMGKDANAQAILNYLCGNTDLQVPYNHGVVAIADRCPVQMGLAPILDTFIEHRREVIECGSRFDLRKEEDHCHILEGLTKMVSTLDGITALVRASKGKADSKRCIISTFAFSNTQAETIVIMRLYRLFPADITQLYEKYATLLNEIEELHDILENPKILKKVMIHELNEMKRAFKTPRLANIKYEIGEIIIDKLTMISSEQVMFAISRDGYFKWVSIYSYSAGRSDTTDLREGDHPVDHGKVNTLDHVLLFITQGTYGYTPVYDIEESHQKEIGGHINSTIRIDREEEITDALVLRNLATNAYMISIAKNGFIEKTAAQECEVSWNSKTMSNMKLLDGDAVMRAVVAYAYDETPIALESDLVSRYPVPLIPETPSRSKGVKTTNLALGEIVSTCTSRGDASQLIVFTDRCQMRRIKLSDIDVTGYPTRGSMIRKKVKSKPYRITHVTLHDLNNELAIINEETQKILAENISLMSRDVIFPSPLHTTQDYYFLWTLTAVEQRKLPAIQEEKQEFEEIELFGN